MECVHPAELKCGFGETEHVHRSKTGGFYDACLSNMQRFTLYGTKLLHTVKYYTVGKNKNYKYVQFKFFF